MKPSSRIEEIEEKLKKEYLPLGRDGEFSTAQLARIKSRAITAYLDEQAQESKALEEWVCTMENAMCSHPQCKYSCQACLGSGVVRSFRDCQLADEAKPQDEPKEKKLCPMCIEGGSHRLPTDSIMTGTWICFCPCHQKETKPTINKPLWN